MGKIIRLTESELVRLVKKVIEEQSTTITPKISGSPRQFLMSNSKEPNPALGVSVVPKCYEYFRNNSSLYGFNYAPSESELEHYKDYLTVYGKVPGTGIPIPYESSDLQYMKQLLQGSGIPGAFGGNFNELPALYKRTTEYKGKIYPTVEIIRADFNKITKAVGSLWGALQKRLTDSKEDLEQKQDIIGTLEYAYQTWIDCVNGKRTDVDA